MDGEITYTPGKVKPWVQSPVKILNAIATLENCHISNTTRLMSVLIPMLKSPRIVYVVGSEYLWNLMQKMILYEFC